VNDERGSSGEVSDKRGSSRGLLALFREKQRIQNALHADKKAPLHSLSPTASPRRPRSDSTPDRDHLVSGATAIVQRMTKAEIEVEVQKLKDTKKSLQSDFRSVLSKRKGALVSDQLTKVTSSQGLDTRQILEAIRENERLLVMFQDEVRTASLTSPHVKQLLAETQKAHIRETTVHDRTCVSAEERELPLVQKREFSVQNLSKRNSTDIPTIGTRLRCKTSPDRFMPYGFVDV
jgi:hypothetical protein